MTLQRLFSLLPVLAVLAYLGSAVDGWLFADFGIPPLYGQIAALAFLTGHVAVTAMVSGTGRFPLAPATIAIFCLILVYTLWTAISYLYAPPREMVVETLIARVKTALFLMVFILVFADARVRAGFAHVAAGLVLLGSALVVFDFIQPTFSSVPGRGAGFYMNANDAGTALVLFALVATSRTNVLLNYVLWGVAAAGVLVTFSRGSWLLLVIAVFGLSIVGRLGGGRGRFLFIAAIVTVFLFVLGTYLSGDLYLFVSRSPIAEFLDPNTLARLGAQGVAFDDYSSIEREDVLALGFEKFFESPLLGYGVGSTHVWEESVSTHNMIALLGAELGIVGIATYLAMLAMVLIHAPSLGRVVALAMLLWGMTTHNQLDDPNLVIPFAFAIAAIPIRDPASRRRQGAAQPVRPSRGQAAAA